eukprot:TRINITY_DN5445_c0_g1_i4.p1 TRINITY_DN5445_c0_g1~~TRINITY_DN5445_c0_g1_i4.p1  ORF type:complete len:165 (-),score=68.44 TRINITY_DN5445_c0_g1_i4:54-524(-)
MGKCHMGRVFYSNYCSLDIVIMNILIISSSLLLVLSFLAPQCSTAPTPGGGGFFLEDLFYDAPILGLGLGAAGGALATGVAGLAAAGAVAGKINTLANVANAKINLLNLGSSLVESGASLLGGGSEGDSSSTAKPTAQYRPVYNYPSRYRYNSYGR